MKVTTQEVTKTEVFVEIDGQQFPAYSVKEILEALYGTDPYFNKIVIHDYDLGKALGAVGVLWKSVRGSVAKGKGYEAFVKEFEAATGYEVEKE